MLRENIWNLWRNKTPAPLSHTFKCRVETPVPTKWQVFWHTRRGLYDRGMWTLLISQTGRKKTMKLPRRSVCEGFRASQACSPVLYTDTALCHLGTRRLYLVNVMVSFVLLNVRYYYDSQTPFLSQIDSLLFVSKKKKLRMLNTKGEATPSPWLAMDWVIVAVSERTGNVWGKGLVGSRSHCCSKKEQTEGNCSASVLHDLDYLDCKVLLYSQIRVQIFYSYLPLYK